MLFLLFCFCLVLFVCLLFFFFFVILFCFFFGFVSLFVFVLFFFFCFFFFLFFFWGGGVVSVFFRLFFFFFFFFVLGFFSFLILKVAKRTCKYCFLLFVDNLPLPISFRAFCFVLFSPFIVFVCFFVELLFCLFPEKALLYALKQNKPKKVNGLRSSQISFFHLHGFQKRAGTLLL